MTIICNLKLREVSTESAIDSTLINMNALYDSKRYFLFCAFDINPRQSLRGLASLPPVFRQWGLSYGVRFRYRVDIIG